MRETAALLANDGDSCSPRERGRQLLSPNERGLASSITNIPVMGLEIFSQGNSERNVLEELAQGVVGVPSVEEEEGEEEEDSRNQGTSEQQPPQQCDDDVSRAVVVEERGEGEGEERQ